MSALNSIIARSLSSWTEQIPTLGKEKKSGSKIRMVVVNLPTFLMNLICYLMNSVRNGRDENGDQTFDLIYHVGNIVYGTL